MSQPGGIERWDELSKLAEEEVEEGLASIPLRNQGLLDPINLGKVLHKVVEERVHQEAKWGEQNHFAPSWLMIFQEELGETIQAYLQGRIDDYMEELTQCIAVLVAWQECEFRRDVKLSEAQEKFLKEQKEKEEAYNE